MIDAFFSLDDVGPDEVLNPHDVAASQWGGPAPTMRGVAISALLAREAERTLGSLDGADTFRPARWTVDLFRPTAMQPVIASAHVVRRGRRLCLLDVLLIQQDRPVARASGMFLAPGGQSRGKTWSGDPAPPPPPDHLWSDPDSKRLYFSDSIGWTATLDKHINADRKQLWSLPIAVVEGESPSPFQHAAMLADFANVVGNLGDAGVEYINTDLTLTLARQPGDGPLGLAGIHRVETDGIAVATAVMFDSAGMLGSVSITALANGQHAVDPRTMGTRY
jgi:hypothetical protein